MPNEDPKIICFGGYNDEEGKCDDGEMFAIGTKVQSVTTFDLCSRMSVYGFMHNTGEKIIG